MSGNCEFGFERTPAPEYPNGTWNAVIRSTLTAPNNSFVTIAYNPNEDLFVTKDRIKKAFWDKYKVETSPFLTGTRPEEYRLQK